MVRDPGMDAAKRDEGGVTNEVVEINLLRLRSPARLHHSAELAAEDLLGSTSKPSHPNASPPTNGIEPFS